jgi:hypothetical protein
MGPDLEGNPEIDGWRKQTLGLSFHQWELVVWCLGLPLVTYLILGSGIAAHRRASTGEGIVALALAGASAAYASVLTSRELYVAMWDASIYWSNWAGWTYYDFTVRFFIYAPAVAIATGVLLLAVRGGQEALHIWPVLGPQAEESTGQTA